MNGRRAKQLRRQVFGEKGSHRVRQYKADVEEAIRLHQAVRGPDGKLRYKNMPTIFDGGRRGIYQKAKKLMKKGDKKDEKKDM